MMEVEHIWSEVSEDGHGIRLQVKFPNTDFGDCGPYLGKTEEIKLTKSQAFFLVARLLDSLEQL